MATDTFSSTTTGIDGPASNFAPITPNDSTDLTFVTRTIYVGTGGNVAVVGPTGATAVFKNVFAGASLPIRVSRVLATGTTATDLVALW